MKLTRLTDADDTESYLTTFERLMKAYEVDKVRWAFKLAPQQATPPLTRATRSATPL